MNRCKIFLESISKLGLTESQLNGVMSLMETVLIDDNKYFDEDFDEPDPEDDDDDNNDNEYHFDNDEDEEIYTSEWKESDRQAYHNAEPLFISKNGQPSKITSLLKEAWEDELESCGIEIEKVREYKRSRFDGWPNINVVFSWTDDWDKGTRAKGKVNLRLNWKGKLSFVIIDERTRRNMNPYLYRFEGEDISKFEDHYEVSPKYDLAHVKDFIQEVIDKVLLFTTLNRNFLFHTR